jgi:hypothetical protein
VGEKSETYCTMGFYCVEQNSRLGCPYAEVFGGLKNKIENQYGGSLVGGEEAAKRRMESGTKRHYGKILGA